MSIASQYLRPLPGAEALELSACHGTRTIAQAKDVFSVNIDPDFKKWGLDVAGEQTPAARAQVHELVKDGTFFQIFNSLSSDLDKFAWMQDQVIEFCQKHAHWLRQDGYATLFLIKEGGKFFVVHVSVDSDGLFVSVHRFGNGHVWFVEDRNRLVL